MKNYAYIKKVIIGSTLGAALLFGAVVTASARDLSKETLKYQAAKAQADMRYNEYLTTGSSSDYRKWQSAQSRLAKRYNKLVAAGGDVRVIAEPDMSVSSTSGVYTQDEN